jgi:nucleoside-diphosphate-sugar epimerase
MDQSYEATMKVLVTGGGGFLGTYICQQLLDKGHEVINFSRNEYTHLANLGIVTVKGDLTVKDSITSALDGVDAIVHTAALAGVWGDYDQYYQINTVGTQNLVDAAKSNGIKYLVYTSSPSVVFGKDDLCGVDESIDYPDKYYTAYAETKAMAEQYVLKNHGEGFRTLAIRPHLIWGPGDPHIFPRLIEKGKLGKLKVVGDGENLVDIIYVENAASAHVKALEALLDNHAIGGKPYFVGQSEPVKLWDFINQVLALAKVDPIEDFVSFKTAFFMGGILEKVFKLVGIKKPEPPMTRFVALQLAKSHYFSHQNAKEAFGYAADISVEEGLKRTFHERMEKKAIVELRSNMDSETVTDRIAQSSPDETL